MDITVTEETVTRDGTAGILLYSLTAPDSPQQDYTPECLEDPEPTADHTVRTDEAPRQYELEPDETGTDRLIVTDDPTVEGCFPSSEYRFEPGQHVDDVEFLGIHHCDRVALQRPNGTSKWTVTDFHLISS